VRIACPKNSPTCEAQQPPTGIYCSTVRGAEQSPLDPDLDMPDFLELN
jgi:murein endopeptidase